MGTTLTGTTPQDTYDSLIKVTDNGPLSGTLKKLTDGLGNDSSLSLSTTAASLSGTLAVSGASTFSSAITMALGGSPRLTLQDTDAGAGNVGILFQESTSPKWTLASVGGNFAFFNEATSSNAIYVSSTNNVGIGTSSPASKLVIVSDDPSQVSVEAISGNTNSQINLKPIGTGIAYIKNQANTDFAFGTNNTERIRILAAGGLTFNGDTAAANALDDYEEGTWTMGIAFDGASTGVTYNFRAATYTKIGRQVTVNGYMVLSSKGSSTGIASITGLPFTIGSGTGNYAAVTFRLFNVSYTGQFQGVADIATTTLSIGQVTEAGVGSNFTNTNFENTSGIMVSATYFVS